MSGRPLEIEDPSNRWFIHRLSAALLPNAIRWRLSPNTISLAGLASGVFAGGLYAHAPSVLACVAGLLFMICWHVFDGLDGQLARATGKTSPLGRVLDGVCDHGTFLAVYLGLGWSLQAQGHPHWGLILLAALAHAVQANFYEARRQAYILRKAGKPALQPVKTSTGFGGEALYDAVQNMSLAWTRRTDIILTGAIDPVSARDAYAVAVTPVIKAWALLGANLRTLVIFICCMFPLGAKTYLIWEIAGLTIVLIVLEIWLRKAERTFVNAQSAG
jgi:CDP-diacylglycerol---serine O-phosphatidyltransferase